MMMNLFRNLFINTVLLCTVGACMAAESLGDDADINSYLKKEEEILATIKDYASARKAATQLKQLKKNAPKFCITYCDPRMAQLNNIEQQLEDAYFYGCPVLARTMGYDWRDAIIPTPVSETKLKQLKKAARDNLKGYLTPEQLTEVSGGPGFSADEAWVLSTVDSDAAYELSSRVAMNCMEDVHCSTCRQVIIGERRYDVHTVTLIYNDTKHLIEQWVDCTASHKVYPEAERKAAMQELLNRYRKIHQYLMGIHDKDSAQAAMDSICPLIEIEEHERLCDIAETSYSMYGFFRLILTEEEFENYCLKQKSIREADYYGVELLRDFLYVPPCQ